MRRFEIIPKYKDEGIELPKRASKHSAGYDLAISEDVEIQPGEIKLVPTGLKVKMPENEALFVFPRSSLAIKTGLMMSNGVGIVDADYYGEGNKGHIFIPLLNIRKEPVFLKKGDRIAQGVFLNFFKTIDDLGNNIQRLGGFGSSGL